MISVAEAKSLIHAHVRPAQPAMMPLPAAAGLTLANDVFAPADFPLFAQSAMDGYAFRFEDLQQFHSLTVRGTVAAGAAADTPVNSGEAVRIFTGAALPPGVDTVVMQEKTRIADGVVFIEDRDIMLGSNVRPPASEMAKGSLALRAGTVLTAGALGFCAMLGLSALQVYPPPSVSLLITGKELVPPGTLTAKGQVYECNSFALVAALKRLGVQTIDVQWVDDTLEAVVAALQNGLERSSLVLLTGGVSVGDYDFVAQACEQCGVEKLFHRVAQKPGKPLFFGVKDETPVFGLPGNPGSVLTCFYEYVVPAVDSMMQQGNRLIVQHLRLEETVQKKTRLTHFLKGFASGGRVMPLGAQDSYRLSSFAAANCLIVLEPETEFLEKGAEVEVHLLPI